MGGGGREVGNWRELPWEERKLKKVDKMYPAQVRIRNQLVEDFSKLLFGLYNGSMERLPILPQNEANCLLSIHG